MMSEVIIPIYKPVGPTSHDMVDQVRRITGTRKVGHAGTLDPLASGVLVMGINQGTKQLGKLTSGDKEYRAEIKFGATSTTDDREGRLKLKPTDIRPTLNEVKKILRQMTGKVYQQPPQFSAIKIHGRAAYKSARKGIKLELKPRLVTIESIEIEDYQWPLLKIKVVCGPGVYIRALARDIGHGLGTGGYLNALERTRVGRYTLDKTKTIDQLQTEWETSDRR